MLVKVGDFAQGIVSAAMGVAGEVIQRFELAEDSDIDEGTKGGSQNVIVPTTTNPPDRNYNKLRLRCLPLPKTAEWLVLMGPDGTLHFG